MFLFFIAIVAFALCWTSFLGATAYRVLHKKFVFAPRSMCPGCGNKIAWYDLFPVISWFILKGKCRACKGLISWLYPATELVGAVALSVIAIQHVQLHGLTLLSGVIGKLLFVSALIIVTRTDLEAMIIPRQFSLFLVPLWLLFSPTTVTPYGLVESGIGAFVGYAVPWLFAVCFKLIRKKQGLGEGDSELLCMVGAFLGPVGVMRTLFIGAISGLVAGVTYLGATGKSRSTYIPFAPFLALGALITLFFGLY